MRDLTAQLLEGFNLFVLGYFVVLNTLYLALTLLAATGISRHLRRLSFAGYDEIRQKYVRTSPEIEQFSYERRKPGGRLEIVRNKLNSPFLLFCLLDDCA